MALPSRQPNMVGIYAYSLEARYGKHSQGFHLSAKFSIVPPFSNSPSVITVHSLSRKEMNIDQSSRCGYKWSLSIMVLQLLCMKY